MAAYKMRAIFGVAATVLFALIGYYTRGFPVALSDTHSGFGSGMFKFIWFAMLTGFGVIVGSGFGWRLDNKATGAQRQPARRTRTWPSQATVPFKWGWNRFRGQSLTHWVRRFWLLSGILLGLYVGMTNRHWADEIDNGVFRFTTKLSLVLTGVFVGYLVFAWLAKKVTGVIHKVSPPTPARPGPTP